MGEKTIYSYSVQVYCARCGNRVGMVKQGNTWIEIVCMDCVESNATASAKKTGKTFWGKFFGWDY